ncbi:hypothetical protein A3Q56_07515 [Intoshia linei]|uniref:Uncharacterized protein n=1 Tax=Intoshia linei TaxID=1819745 RepID=A0A177AS07_9BILA|nr:hypothetical protein A3Q56_07515 [Intoshia linei]
MQNSSLDTCLKETNRRKRIKLACESHECHLVLPDSELLCRVCNKTISSAKNYNINAYLKTQSHLSNIIVQPVQSCTDDNFKCLLGKAFLSAVIPFSKLRNKHEKII